MSTLGILFVDSLKQTFRGSEMTTCEANTLKLTGVSRALSRELEAVSKTYSIDHRVKAIGYRGRCLVGFEASYFLPNNICLTR